MNTEEQNQIAKNIADKVAELNEILEKAHSAGIRYDVSGAKIQYAYNSEYFTSVKINLYNIISEQC